MPPTLLPSSPVVSLAPAPRRPSPGAAGLLVALAAALAAGPALAERGDRNKPMTIDSSGTTPDVVDLSKHSAVFTGNVVITQGTMVMHADRVEVSEDPDGQRLGTATGSPGRPATFRQKRDGGPDEYSEGEADRIEYDSAANRVRFIGNAKLRMLRGATVTDQASAAQITYDTAADTIALNGGGASGKAGDSKTTSSGGRTTVVFTPKPAGSAPARPQPSLEDAVPQFSSGPKK